MPSILEEFSTLKERIERDKEIITKAELERLKSTLQLLGAPTCMGKISFRTCHSFVYEQIVANDYALIRKMLGEPCKGVTVNINKYVENGIHIALSLEA